VGLAIQLGIEQGRRIVDKDKPTIENLLDLIEKLLKKNKELKKTENHNEIF